MREGRTLWAALLLAGCLAWAGGCGEGADRKLVLPEEGGPVQRPPSFSGAPGPRPAPEPPADTPTQAPQDDSPGEAPAVPPAPGEP